MGQSSMRDLVIAVGGPIEAGQENLKSWLAKVARRSGLSYRVIRAAWHGEQLSRATEQKLKIAAGRYEAQILAQRFENLAQSLRHTDEDFHVERIAAFSHAARLLRGMGGAGNGD